MEARAFEYNGLITTVRPKVGLDNSMMELSANTKLIHEESTVALLSSLVHDGESVCN